MGDKGGAVSTDSDKRFTCSPEADIARIGRAEIAASQGDVITREGVGFGDVSTTTGDGLHHQGRGAIASSLQDAAVDNGDIISIDDVASTGPEPAEGANRLRCCTTTTTDGLCKQRGSIDAGGCDGTVVGDADAATTGIAYK